MTANILVFTGDGKGKTTAALGMAMRALGHGQSVLFVQFVKSDTFSGEQVAANRLEGLELMQTGLGFVPTQDHPSFGEHVSAARQGMEICAEAIAHGLYDMVVMDEICVAVSKGLIDGETVARVLEDAPDQITVVLTGRNAPEWLIGRADTVTTMQCIKHALGSGVGARKGIEY